MKRTVPLLIAAVCGVVLIITAFIPATVSWGETAAVWFDVLAAIAFILGGGNLLKVHLQKVSDRAAGWAYSFITVATFIITLWVGMVKWGVPPSPDQEFFGQTFASLAVSDLPEELHFELPVNLPARLVDHELPTSVRRQLELVQETEGDEQRITAFKFRGWITPGQVSELLHFHDLLEWKCTIEQLAEVAGMPAELRGRVSYFADHQALSVTGVLKPEEAEKLKSISASPQWQAAIEKLTSLTSQTTTTLLSSLPPQFQIPESLQGSLELQGNNLTVTGPLTPAMRSTLTGIFPRIRPVTEEEIHTFVDAVESLPGGLQVDQQNLLVGLLHSIWTPQQLVTTLDEAGKRLPTTKSYCELLAEKQAGVAELVATVPPTEPDVTLNEAQIEALETAVTTEGTDLHSLGETLAPLGLWLPSQEAALQRFLASMPTIGQWKRSLAVALTAGGGQLSREQFELLLADYRAEHEWNEQISGLFRASHRVKYPWSGGYLQDGSPFWWSYEYALKPLTATMFALLAFYVASAAFRAFRAKNFEAFLLLATAFIVLLGRTYTGVWLTSGLPDSLAGLRIENITIFIMSVINTAGNRAIMIGIALGIVSTSLKILLGVDRSYLGSNDS